MSQDNESGSVTFTKKEMRYIGYATQDVKPPEFTVVEWNDFVKKSDGLVGKVAVE